MDTMSYTVELAADATEGEIDTAETVVAEFLSSAVHPHYDLRYTQLVRFTHDTDEDVLSVTGVLGPEETGG